MRLALLTSVLVLQTVFAAAPVDPKTEPMPTPLMRTVDPYTAKAGSEITVTGDNLDKKIVAEVYLSANGKNAKVEVTSQAEKELKFKVPQNTKAGAYRIVVLVRSVEPILIEEPVRVVIEE
ncbi:MAG: IPT/TIG domain-containing protein [Bryobacteraceae bacterium]|nr:IPT/TIG domain-containing protein [Bryobacteraceae bacterium]